MALFKDVKVGDYYHRSKLQDMIVTKATPLHITVLIIYHMSDTTRAYIQFDYACGPQEWNDIAELATEPVSTPTTNDKKRIVSTIFAYSLERQ